MSVLSITRNLFKLGSLVTIYIDKYRYITCCCNIYVLPISGVRKIVIVVGAIDGSDSIQTDEVDRASQTHGLLSREIG